MVQLGIREGNPGMSNSWTAVYTNRRGEQFRFRLFEDRKGKHFLQISADEIVPYTIGLKSSGGDLIHFRTENIVAQEKEPKTREE
jgi:hypothetical protein